MEFYFLKCNFKIIHLVYIFLNVFSFKYKIIIFPQFYYSFYSQYSYKKTHMFRYNAPRKCFRKERILIISCSFSVKSHLRKYIHFNLLQDFGVNFYSYCITVFSVFSRKFVKIYLIKYQYFNSENCLRIVREFLIICQAF